MFDGDSEHWHNECFKPLCDCDGSVHFKEACERDDWKPRTPPTPRGKFALKVAAGLAGDATAVVLGLSLLLLGRRMAFHEGSN